MKRLGWDVEVVYLYKLHNMSMVRNLSITTKMILIILVSICFLASVLYFISASVLSKSYLTIEHQAILKDLERANGAIDNLSTQLTVKLHDWATWDDTYNFILDSNQEYLESNLAHDSIANLEINAMFFVDKEGGIIFKRMVDSQTSEEIDSVKIGEFIESHRDLVIHDDVGRSLELFHQIMAR
jgi:sensor domain CHASE-containing protein